MGAGVIDKINIFRPDRVFMVTLPVQYFSYLILI